jgi:hypothetical protein
MPEKAEALGVLLILLPGFASAYVVQMLAVRRKQSEMDKVLEALLFSLLFYLITFKFFGNTLPISWRALDAKQPDVYQVVLQRGHLAALAGLALVFGVGYATLINHDWLMIAFRWMRVTERTARSTIWNDAFQEIGGFVQVGISDGRSLIGWLRHYSDESEEGSLFLEDAAWIVKKDRIEEEVAIVGPGILLTKETAIEYVIFLGWHKKVPEGTKMDQSADG